MKHIKLFEDFRNNNADGSLITSDDIKKLYQSRRCIIRNY
jgi:Tfp pilus assembly ATPase PilU